MILKIKETTVGEKNRTLSIIGHDETNTTHNYFTAMSWSADSRHLCLQVSNTDKNRSDTCQLKVDPVSGKSILIHDGPCGGVVVSFQNQMFFTTEAGKQIRTIDLETGTNRLVISFDEGLKSMGPLSVTNDGQFIGCNLMRHGEYACAIIRVDTGEILQVFVPGFEKPNDRVSHTMINPVHPHLLFYCHEGKPKEISDRIWVLNTNTGLTENIFRQGKMEDGTHGDYVGHEMWDYSGSGLYFIKYGSNLIKPSGIFYIGMNKKEAEFINGDYRYWHAAVSPDGRYVVADTNADNRSKIVLIDTRTKQSEILCEIDRWEQHPGHPHPSFSPDSKKISFTLAGRNNELKVGVINLE